jgi:hypothetical protein
MTDFTRAFRPPKTFQHPEEAARADRTLLAHLRALTRDGMRERLGQWLTSADIDAVLGRREPRCSMTCPGGGAVGSWSRSMTAAAAEGVRQ